MKDLPNLIAPSFSENVQFPYPEDSFLLKISPSNKINDKYDFHCPKYENTFLDFYNTKLQVKFRILKKDKSELGVLKEGEYLSAANSLLSSLFPTVNVSLNNVNLTQCSMNHYYAHLISMLNYSANYRSNVLRSSGYFDSMAGQIEATDSDAFNQISGLLEKSKQVDLVGKLITPFFMSKVKLLPPSADLFVSLSAATPELFLITNVEDLIIDILECNLILRYIRVPRNLMDSFNTQMKNQIYKIPFSKTIMRAIQIPKGLDLFSTHNLFSSCPSKMIFTLVESEKYLGSLKSSPYAFSPGGLVDYKISFNGQNLPLIKPTFNFEKKSALQLYETVLSNLGIDQDFSVSPNLTYDRFLEELFLIAQSFQFNTGTAPVSSSFNSNIGLELKFSKSLEKNLTLIIFAEYNDSFVSINQLGEVTVN
jgi:hypothetical protein